jgi:hypothetical protein
MAIQRIDLSTPCSLRGLEQEFPKELQEPMLELIRRNETNREALIRDLRSQVVVDTSVLPSMTNGEATTETATVMLSSDMDDMAKESLMLHIYG